MQMAGDGAALRARTFVVTKYCVTREYAKCKNPAYNIFDRKLSVV